VLQDVRTLDGQQFRGASLIVASPPCQAYSYRAMPWKRAKALPPPDNKLFEACFRIQRECSEACGCYVPMVVENVCGAQKWVGRAKWHYGSFYLWGDVPALMPHTLSGLKAPAGNQTGNGNKVWNNRPIKRLEDVPSHALRSGQKVPVYSDPRRNGGRGVHLTSPWETYEGVKNGNDWFGSGKNCSEQRRHASRSRARKEVSARIAMIPFPLAEWIGQVYYPPEVSVCP
jgi:hypothetical protein